MPVHCEQNDVHDPSNVGAVLDPEDMEEVVEDILEHRRPVEVLLTGDQNLRLVRVAGYLQNPTLVGQQSLPPVAPPGKEYLFGRQVGPHAGLVCRLVQSQELQWPVDAGQQSRYITFRRCGRRRRRRWVVQAGNAAVAKGRRGGGERPVWSVHPSVGQRI